MGGRRTAISGFALLVILAVVAAWLLGAAAVAMAETLDADPGLVNAHAGFAPRPAHRPETKFERRGVTSGRSIFDLIYRRV